MNDQLTTVETASVRVLNAIASAIERLSPVELTIGVGILFVSGAYVIDRACSRGYTISFEHGRLKMAPNDHYMETA